MKTIKVVHCRKCYFSNWNDYYYSCDLDNDLIHPINKETIPNDCPLKKEPVKVELESGGNG